MIGPQFIRAAVAAELKRARLVGRDPDRLWLRRETGLASKRLEALIADINLASNPAPLGAGGDAERLACKGPTPATRRQAASPTRPRLSIFNRYQGRARP